MVEIVHFRVKESGLKILDRVYWQRVQLREVILAVVNNSTARIVDVGAISPKFKTKADLKEWILENLHVLTYDKEYHVYTAERQVGPEFTNVS